MEDGFWRGGLTWRGTFGKFEGGFEMELRRG
jgi:hypothetical protein